MRTFKTLFDAAADFLLDRNFSRADLRHPGPLNGDIPDSLFDETDLDLHNPRLEINTFLNAAISADHDDDDGLLGPTAPAPAPAPGKPKKQVQFNTRRRVRVFAVEQDPGSTTARPFKWGSARVKAAFGRVPVQDEGGDVATRLVQLSAEAAVAQVQLTWARAGSSTLLPWTAAVPELVRAANEALPLGDVGPWNVAEDRGAGGPVLDWLDVVFNLGKTQTAVRKLERRFGSAARALADLRAALGGRLGQLEAAAVAYGGGHSEHSDNSDGSDDSEPALEACLDNALRHLASANRALGPTYDQIDVTIEAAHAALEASSTGPPARRLHRVNALMMLIFKVLREIGEDVVDLKRTLSNDEAALSHALAAARSTTHPDSGFDPIGRWEAHADALDRILAVSRKYAQTAHVSRLLRAMICRRRGEYTEEQEEGADGHQPDDRNPLRTGHVRVVPPTVPPPEDGDEPGAEEDDADERDSEISEAASERLRKRSGCVFTAVPDVPEQSDGPETW